MKKFILIVTLILGSNISLKAASQTTEALFARTKDRIVQVRLVERFSNEKAVIGSGFFVTGAGHIMTNYHVISDFVHHPDRYQIEVVLTQGSNLVATLSGFDAIHDIAVIKVKNSPHGALRMRSKKILKGTKIYSLGNPHDLGLSIVEGTYNGLIEKSLYKKIHFTGSLNPGMSGGPTIDAEGRVVGINVATSGNQVSFLVPEQFGRQLKETVLKKKKSQKENLTILRDQMEKNQRDYLTTLIKGSPESIDLGSYRLPGKLSQAFKCWGDNQTRENRSFELVSYSCSTEDKIYISRSHSSGSIWFRHDYLTGSKLNPFLFYNIYQDYFGDDFRRLYGGEEDVTNFECTADFLELDGSNFRAAYCLRSFKKLPGLYDVVFRAASLNEGRAGVITSLALSGVTVEDSRNFIEYYLRTIQWKK